MKKCKAVTYTGKICDREAMLLGYCIRHFTIHVKIKKPKVQPM